MDAESRRLAIVGQLAAVEVDPALSTYLLRGTSLGDCVVSRITFDKALTATVVRDVLTFARRMTDREFLPYDPSYQLASNQVIADDLSSLSVVQRVCASIEGGDVPIDAGADTPVVAMVHRVESAGSEAVTVLRLKGAGIATRRPRGVLALLPNKGVFTEVDQEIVFYEPQFHVLVCGTDVVVPTITVLSRQLEAPERAQAKAREVFVRATVNVAIEGAELLADAVASDPAMIAKMMAVSRLLDEDPGYAELLTTQNLVAFLRKNPHVEITVAGKGKEARLVFDPAPQTRYRIVKALADDYLLSQLSGRRYEAGSKLRL